MRTIKFYFMILAFFLTAGFVSRAASVVDIIVNSPNHNTLETAVVTAGLVPALQGTGPFTVFAPTDDAFAALPAGTLSALLADIPALTDVLLYHVADGKVLSSDLNGVQTIKTLAGKNITVVVINGSVYINSAKVTVADIVADNGVVHVIDAVLLPPVSLPETVMDIIGNSPDHSNLNFALSVTGLEDDLRAAGPFTVFAPTDAAFKAIPKDVLDALFVNSSELKKILLNHVVGSKTMSSNLNNEQKISTLLGKKVKVTINENGVFINNAKVTVADIEADNGVVHVIDAVLIPSSLPSTVVDIVVNSENHTTLEAAVVAAGLVETLQGAGPFTVFAPTDAAFAALPAGTVEALLADIPALTNILTYHVAGVKAMSTDLSNGQKVVTVQGMEVTVTINENGVFINNAKVTVADIEADNGVVHVIDAVLLPTTGIDSELDEISFDVYPNPTSDYIRIKSNIDVESLIIRDMAGRVVTQRNNLDALEKVELNGYKPGLYLVTMKNGNSVSTKKLIVR